MPSTSTSEPAVALRRGSGASGGSGGGGASQPASGGVASQPAAWDPRLRAARKWYESAYEWRIVSYAMHTQARLNAHDDGKLLFYISAVDKPAVFGAAEKSTTIHRSWRATS